MEQALQKSEEEHRSVVESVIDSIAITSDDRWVFVNSAFRELYGIDEDCNVADFSVYEAVVPEDLEKVIERRDARLRGEPVPQRSEHRIQRPDGTIRNVEVSAGDITFQGKPGRLAVLRDITEGKQAVEALREREELYRAVVESVNDAIVIHKEGKLEGSIVYSSLIRKKKTVRKCPNCAKKSQSLKYLMGRK